MTGTEYRRALGAAAQALRAERGHRSARALHDATGFSLGNAYRVEGGKELERTLSLATIEAYADAIGSSLGELFTRADAILKRDQSSGIAEGSSDATYSRKKVD